MKGLKFGHHWRDAGIGAEGLVSQDRPSDRKAGVNREQSDERILQAIADLSAQVQECYQILKSIESEKKGQALFQEPL